MVATPVYQARELVALARERYPAWDSFAHPAFVADEIAPRRQAARLAQELLSPAGLEPLVQAARYEEILARLEQLSRATHLLWTAQASRGDLALLYQPQLPRPAFGAHLYSLLHGQAPVEARLDEYTAFLTRHALPNTWPLPTYLLSLLNPTGDILVKPRLTYWFMQFMGAGEHYRPQPSGAAYRVIRQQAQVLQAQLTDYAPQDLLDTQSLLWVAYEVSRARGGGLTLKDQIELDQPPIYEATLPPLPVLAEEGGRYIAADSAETMSNLSEPFAKIFASPAEAEWAFDFLQDTIQHLTQGRDDPRLALTLPKGATASLSLDYGKWLVARFRRRLTRTVVSVCLLTELAPTEAAYRRSEPFAAAQGEPEARIWWDIPLSEMAALLPVYRATLAHIAGRFAHWRNTHQRSLHQASIFEAVINPTLRATLLAGKLVSVATVETLPPRLPAHDLRALSQETSLNEADLAVWVAAVERKGQAIFYGPPGTGKTFVAQRLARHLVSGGDGFVEMVQFHPAYAYEDFIQGIRPITAAGQLTYENQPGRFLDFCRRAQLCRGTCVLILDEINRADLARVFGELMLLLEYRQTTIPLAGGGELSIPPNVRLLGTMNTADRSIALVDYALRRRFAFIPLRPNMAVLRRFHAGSTFPVERLIELLEQLNQLLEPDYQVGTSYFLRERLAEELPSIWQLEIETYLEEYFYNQRDRVTLWRWAEVGQRLLG